MPFAKSLSIYCLRSLSSIKLTLKKIHFSLKCFSHIPLICSISCLSCCCCLKSRVGKIHSCPPNGFFLQTKGSKFILAFFPLLQFLKKKLGRIREGRYLETFHIPAYTNSYGMKLKYSTIYRNTTLD